MPQVRAGFLRTPLRGEGVLRNPPEARLLHSYLPVFPANPERTSGLCYWPERSEPPRTAVLPPQPIEARRFPQSSKPKTPRRPEPTRSRKSDPKGRSFGPTFAVLTISLAFLGAVAGSCIESEPFECETDAQCNLDGMPGRCQDTGYCAYPDEDCPGGLRYSLDAPEELAGECAE